MVGKLYFAFPFTDNYNATKRMMENYQAWKNDPEVGRMLSLLNKAGSAGNAMIISGNMDLKMADTGDSSEFDWSYTYNGADYSGVSLRFDDYIPSLTFSDNRGIYSVGDTAINTSKQQAIEIAENYVFENVSYSYIFANGTKTTIKSLMGNESDATASLETTARTLSTLYPYWNVQVPLKQGYPAAIESMTVWVWADSGEVFGSNYGPINTSPYPFSVSSLVFFEALLIVIVAAAMIAAAALIVVSRSKPKQNVNQPSTHWILKCKASEEKNLT